ncbi:MAG: hypothetical protein WDM70_11650 [Nitrosomonadales bacterium]
MIPSIGVYYNSTCAQCDAGCNIEGRVREGRVLKLEGNPIQASIAARCAVWASRGAGALQSGSRARAVAEKWLARRGYNLGQGVGPYQ